MTHVVIRRTIRLALLAATAALTVAVLAAGWRDAVEARRARELAREHGWLS